MRMAVAQPAPRVAVNGVEETAMSYKLKVKESAVSGKKKYVNAKGNTECVVFVQQAAGAPVTTKWARGIQVKAASSTKIPRGTAIATFDSKGRYPTDSFGMHAAIYLSHDKDRILVLDQWNSQGEVKQRPIWFNRPKSPRSNNGDTFYIIE